MIRMIVTDLDGTLLRDDKSVSGVTPDVLRRCREAGIKTAIATARGHPEKVVPVDLFDGRITCNGAVVVADGVIYRQSIPYMESRPLLMACSKRGMIISSQFGDTHYAVHDVSAVWPHITKPEIADFSRHAIDSEKINIDSITGDDMAFIEPYLTCGMYIRVARDGLGMIMHRDATKSCAVTKLAQLWGIPLTEVAAFGDDSNDIDMLSAVGYGVAMGNALDEVKAAAGFITLTNDEDGVAVWLESHVL